MMNGINHTSKIFLKFRHELFICIFIIIAIFAAYWQLPKNNFISFDDDIYITKNVHVQSGFTGKNVIWAFTTFHAFNWHPITWLSHMLDYTLFGLNPSMHHFMSLLFHIANSLLLFMVLKAMTDDIWPSAFVAILFAIHPLHVESVAWASERKDLLSTFFWLLTIGSYFRYSKKQSITNYTIIVLLFILGLMSKPMLVTLPFVLLLLDIWPIKRMSHGRFADNSKKENPDASIFYLIVEKIPLFMLSALSSLITFIAQKEGGIVRTLHELSMKVRFANAFVSYIRYIVKMIYPVHLSFYYPYRENLSAWQVFGSVFLMISITLFAMKTIREKPFFLVGWFWYVGTLLPVVGLVQVATQSIADRYTYIPLIGLFIIMAWGAKTVFEKFREHIKPLLSGIILTISVLMNLTWIQVNYWKDDIKLFSHDVAVTMGNPLSNYHLGLSLEKEGKIEKAIQHYTEAIRIKPDFLRARNSLGYAFVKTGRYEDALTQFEEAIKLKKNYADGYFNLGVAAMYLGRADDAIRHYKHAIKLDPNHADAYYNLGIIMTQQKQYKEALNNFMAVIRIHPQDVDAHNFIGNTYLRSGEIDNALKYYKKALDINPNDEIARENLNAVLEKINKNR